MDQRTVHAIRIQLQSVTDRSVIIWLKETRKLCVHLLNPRRTWTTARAGDAVTLNNVGVKSREYIERVELYRVFPASNIEKQTTGEPLKKGPRPVLAESEGNETVNILLPSLSNPE